jgi:alpha-mannosidase
VFDYAVRAGGVWDSVAAWRFGEEFNLPLRAAYVDVPPTQLTRSYFSVDQPGVQIVSVKPISETVIHGEVSATPLDPQLNRVFVVRLQEIAGRAAEVRVALPAKITSAAKLNLTEDAVLQNISQLSPLTIQLKPHETATVRFEIELAK